jgi:hypothetical protein
MPRAGRGRGISRHGRQVNSQSEFAALGSMWPEVRQEGTGDANRKHADIHQMRSGGAIAYFEAT